MKIRQAKKIYFKYFEGEKDQPTHRWKTFITAVHLFVKHTWIKQ